MCSAPKPKAPPPPQIPAEQPVLELESDKRKRKRAQAEDQGGRRSLRIDLNIGGGASPASGLRIPGAQ